MVQTLNIAFTDTYENAIEFFKWALGQRYNVVIDNDNPDYLIYGDSNFGVNHYHQKYDNCKKIFFTGENVRPDYSECNFAISFDEENSPRHYRLPLYVLEMWAITKDNNPNGLYTFDFLTKHRPKIKDDAIFGAAYIQSNPMVPFRNLVAGDLRAYNLLYSAGPHMNTMGYIVHRDRSLKFQFFSHYVFGLAMENGSYPGYVTEKLLDCYYAGCIPIYWGSKHIDRDFNPGSMLIIDEKTYNPFDFYERLKNYENPENRQDILNQPVFNNNVLPSYAYVELFLNWFDRFVK